MKTKISNSGEVTVVEVSGFLDFETAKPFARSIEELYKDNKDAKIIIDLSELEFVGSSGISNFVKGLRGFNKLRMKPSYCGVKSEFKKLFRLFEEATSFELCETQDDAIAISTDRYNQWQINALRSKNTH